MFRKLKADIARHYKAARDLGCREIIWTNEGLYLLNSVQEYQTLLSLFARHSREIVVVCCFREAEAFRISYKKQLQKQGTPFSNDPDSYSYVDPDSWLFDVERKKSLLSEVFKKSLYFSYQREGMVQKFMEELGYSSPVDEELRLNVTAVQPAK